MPRPPQWVRGGRAHPPPSFSRGGGVQVSHLAEGGAAGGGAGAGEETPAWGESKTKATALAAGGGGRGGGGTGFFFGTRGKDVGRGSLQGMVPSAQQEKCLLQRQAHCHLTVRMAGTWEATLGPPCPPLRPDRGRPEARPWGSLPCRRVPPTPAAFPSWFLAEAAGSTCACRGRPCPSLPTEASGGERWRPWARAFLNVLAQCPEPQARGWGQEPWAELGEGLGGRAGPAEREPCPARLPQGRGAHSTRGTRESSRLEKERRLHPTR